jgi:hypothetical protein
MKFHPITGIALAIALLATPATVFALSGHATAKKHSTVERIPFPRRRLETEELFVVTVPSAQPYTEDELEAGFNGLEKLCWAICVGQLVRAEPYSETRDGNWVNGVLLTYIPKPPKAGKD